MIQLLGHPTLVFLTVCTQARAPILAEYPVLDALTRIWREEARHGFVGDFVLLPDHLHLFCTPAEHPTRCSIEHWTQFWKSRATRELGWSPASWQRKGFHHRLRSLQSYQETWTYMRENPVRAGLTRTFEDWPFRGQVDRLEWIA
ncbi:MAG: hypothetical protein JSR82_04600 [Verrucomicrobia bacterium]|nr:hypothetical protein [Verrucomicrobiota bacterium]